MGCDEFEKYAESPFSTLLPAGSGYLYVQLGPESHPLSLTIRKANLLSSSPPGMSEMAAVVSSRAGDWSQKLYTLVQDNERMHNKAADLHVQVEGPFPSGGGAWSLDIAQGQDEPALLHISRWYGCNGMATRSHAPRGAAEAMPPCVGCQSSWRLCCASAAIGERRASNHDIFTYGEDCRTCEREGFLTKFAAGAIHCVHAAQAAHTLSKLTSANGGAHCETQGSLSSLDPSQVQQVGASDHLLQATPT